MAAWPRDLWNNWSIQILVLLSLALQLALFLFAGIRRRGAHRVLRFLLWLAYQLADYTATYALGHLSLKGAPREHPIVAFWAPFLLLHLGGPDNITAYSLEDNKLWKRHLLHTKAPIIHTWFGYTVRLISPFAIVGSLLLFKLIGKDAHRGVDVVITYVLYDGALFMETTSLLNAPGSSWTFAFLSTTRWRYIRYAALCNERWDRLRRLVAYLHHLVRVGGGSPYKSRRWSRIMGQYNMLHFCTRFDTDNGLFTRPLLGRLAKMVGQGLNEWWNREHYSWTIEMPNHVKDCISKHTTKMYMEGGVNSLGMLRNRWGEEPLVREELFHGILKDSLGVESQECIIIWHIGSDVFLAKSQWAKDEDASLDVEAIKVISNYMMFLLVEQPDMLPGLSQNRLYQRTCENLVKTRWSMTSRCQRMNLCAMLKNLFCLHDDPGSSSRVADREELAKILCDEYATKGFSHDAPRLRYVAKLAKHLLTMEEDGTVDSVKLVLDVWTDILVYARNKCSRKAHAGKLNSGGELTTILWLMAEHFYQLYLEGLIQKEKNNVPVEGTNQAGT